MAILEAPLVDAMPVEQPIEQPIKQADNVDEQTVTSQMKARMVKEEILVASPKILVDMGTSVERTFACHKHIRPAQFPEAGPLPFPKEMKKLAAWTDAFVERLGWLAVQQSEKSANFEAQLDRAECDNADLKKRIQELQLQLNTAHDENRHLQEKNSTLCSQNKTLEIRVAQDKEIIKAANEMVATKETKICGLLREIDGLKGTIVGLNALCAKFLDEHNGDEKEIRRLKKQYEEHVKKDAEEQAKHASRDRELEDQLKERTKEVECLKEEAKAAKLLMDAAEDRIEILTRTRDGLEKTLCAKRKELADAHHQLDAANGKIAKLEGEVSLAVVAVKQAEEEIKSLHTKLEEATEREKTALARIQTVKDHAQDHWNTLQNIREQGGWQRTDKGDDCDPVMHVVY